MVLPGCAADPDSSVEAAIRTDRVPVALRRQLRSRVAAIAGAPAGAKTPSRFLEAYIRGHPTEFFLPR